MKIVYYFTDAAKAQQNAMPARVNRHSVTMVDATKFNPATDCEKCDVVWIDGDFPKIKEAYEALGVEVKMPDADDLEHSPEKPDFEHFDIVKSGVAEKEVSEPLPRRGRRG